MRHCNCAPFARPHAFIFSSVATNPPNPPRAVLPHDLEGDAIQPGHPLFGIVWVNPARMSGAPCFFGTRVPVRYLFDFLRAGHSLTEFLEDFSGVTATQAAAVLDRAAEFIIPQSHAA